MSDVNITKASKAFYKDFDMNLYFIKIFINRQEQIKNSKILN